MIFSFICPSYLSASGCMEPPLFIVFLHLPIKAIRVRSKAFILLHASLQPCGWLYQRWRLHYVGTTNILLLSQKNRVFLPNHSVRDDHSLRHLAVLDYGEGIYYTFRLPKTYYIFIWSPWQRNNKNLEIKMKIKGTVVLKYYRDQKTIRVSQDRPERKD